MAERKDTPGPWELEAGFLIYRPANGAGVPLLHLFDSSGEAGFITGEDAENEANARLIAAAPDLLEALETALPAMRLFYSFYGDDEHVSGVAEAVQFRAAMSAVAAAVAKAEGR